MTAQSSEAPGGRVDREVVRQMHEQRIKLSVMAAHFGVTRERIRQVIKEMELPSRLDMIRERNAQIVVQTLASLKDETGEDRPDDEIADENGISTAMVGLIRRQHGLSATDIREQRIKRAIQMVKDGSSIRAAALACTISAGTLTQRLEEQNVQTRHGRWGALDHRLKLIPEMRDRGETWEAIVEEIGKREKRALKLETLRAWVKKHLPDHAVSIGESRDHA